MRVCYSRCVWVQPDILGTEGSCCWPTCSHLSSAGSCRVSAAAAPHKARLCNPPWIDTRSRGNREAETAHLAFFGDFTLTALHATRWTHTFMPDKHTHLLHEGKTNGQIQVTEENMSTAHNFTCRWKIFKPVFFPQHAKYICKCDQGRNSWSRLFAAL